MSGPALKVIALTLFPEMFPGVLGHSLPGKALKEGLWTLEAMNIRDFAEGRHANVDDTPYGGGAGMVMRPDVVGPAIDAAFEKLPGATLIHLTPRGVPLTQGLVRELVERENHPHPNPPPSRGREFTASTSSAQALRKNPTEAEKKLWGILSDTQFEGLKFRRQQPIGPYVVDFVCFDLGLIIEADGGQHAESQKEHDERRTAFLEKEGFHVLRFWNHDILQNPEGIFEHLKSHVTTPCPSRGESWGGGDAIATRQYNSQLILLCGRFEGIDERINEHYRPLEISLGDFVLFGGEVAAMALLEAVLRQCEGALGNPQTLEEESFSIGENSALLLEYPHYTKPPLWKGLTVPEALVSGHHAKIRQWRREQAEAITRERRPDLWDAYRHTREKE
jgi:tRNA G37 N-methylase TrmD